MSQTELFLGRLSITHNNLSIQHSVYYHYNHEKPEDSFLAIPGYFSQRVTNELILTTVCALAKRPNVKWEGGIGDPLTDEPNQVLKAWNVFIKKRGLEPIILN